jgi:hypothetical protein
VDRLTPVRRRGVGDSEPVSSPGRHPSRANGIVAAKGSSTAQDPGHPLHSLLCGFSESHDDLLADDARCDGDAAVDVGPLRYPSAEQPPGDPAGDVPFTPPIPSREREDILRDPSDSGRHSPRLGPSLGPWAARFVPLRAELRPSPRTGVVLVVALVVVVAAAVSQRGTSHPGAAGTATTLTDDQRPGSRTAERETRRARQPRRRARRAVPAPRVTRHSTPRPRARGAVTAAPAEAAPPVAPAMTPPARQRSQFTSEFTP